MAACAKCGAEVAAEGAPNQPQACPRCGAILEAPGDRVEPPDEEPAQRFARKVRQIENVLMAAEGGIPSPQAHSPSSPTAPPDANVQNGAELQVRLLVRRELPPVRQSRWQRIAIVAIVVLLGLVLPSIPLVLVGGWIIAAFLLVIGVPFLAFVMWIFYRVLRDQPPVAEPGRGGRPVGDLPPPTELPDAAKHPTRSITTHSEDSSEGIQERSDRITGA